ncbi:hypothetical protein ACQY74_006670 (plasmid) [Rhizobium leguminosarum bv. trifolii]
MHALNESAVRLYGSTNDNPRIVLSENQLRLSESTMR